MVIRSEDSKLHESFFLQAELAHGVYYSFTIFHFYSFYCWYFPTPEQALRSQAHVFSHKLSMEFFNRLDYSPTRREIRLNG
jgi:hypothetical protein